MLLDDMVLRSLQCAGVKIIFRLCKDKQQQTAGKREWVALMTSAGTIEEYVTVSALLTQSLYPGCFIHKQEHLFIEISHGAILTFLWKISYFQSFCKIYPAVIGFQTSQVQSFFCKLIRSYQLQALTSEE